MVDINSAFPSNYIKASDLQNREVQVQISHCNMEDIGSGEHKPVLYFVGKDKGLVLNKTNANTIASVTGQTDTDMWVNASIILFPTQTDFQGKQVPCIRVKLFNPAPATQQAAPAVQGQPVSNGNPFQAPPAVAGGIDDEIPF